jgi:hypothetical protein
MKGPIAVLCAIAGLVCCLVTSGCASSCSASPHKLALLQRGMTYDEAVQVMGCPGTVLTGPSPASGEFSTVEWNGPEQFFFKRTQLDFLEGKLLSYTTDRRGGL